MITFIISLLLLVLGYAVYSKLIERMLGVDPKRATPATTMADGVDYVPMKPWRVFLIQFLNIAGVGPICGAIMGAQFGTSSFLWIVFGTIFAGAVHDFVSGYISLRHEGCSLPEVHGMYLGNGIRQVMRYFMIVLLILVGVVFVSTPADLLTSQFTPNMDHFVWIVIILGYYLLATLLPIDKVIGKIYPLFGILLIAMAVALVVAFAVYRPEIPELWEGLANAHPRAESNPIFPMMFISIACGAISGFHATQSPLMARCMVNERQARPIFYGAMVTEGVVALVWAAAAAYFYKYLPEQCSESGAAMVGIIAQKWFPQVVAVITILGVISAAVTSGDTAMRSARLIVAEIFHSDQKPIANRLKIAIPLFVVVAGGLVFSLTNQHGFAIIWRYFAWCNQVLAMVTLWAITVYLVRRKKCYVLTLVPALFMTMVTVSFIFVAEDGGLGAIIPREIGNGVGALATLSLLMLFLVKKKKYAVDTIEQ